MTAVATPDVLVVGGGPAGLSAAQVMAGRHRLKVLVVEREEQAGGVPRHCAHTGFGLRDLHRVMQGPAYARELDRVARHAGAEIWTGHMVTGWGPDGSATVTGPDGITAVTPRATILATGARERPRSARFIPGDRPAGIYTTGQLQNLVHLKHRSVGSEAVVLGAELVSWSAVLTLREAGCRTVAVVSAHARPESWGALTLGGRLGLRVPVLTSYRAVGVVGRERVEAVELEHVGDGRRLTIGCDTLLTTGDWVPDHELARSAGAVTDPGSRSPLVDQTLRTSVAGLFAAGNLVHPVDTADVAALGGRHAGDSVAAWLRAGLSEEAPVRIEVQPPLRWVSPGLVLPGGVAPPRRRYTAWVDCWVRTPRVVVTQDGRCVASKRLPWPAAPGRAFRLPDSLFASVRAGAGAVEVRLEG